MKPLRDDLLSGRALEGLTREKQLSLLCQAVVAEQQRPPEEQDAALIGFCLDRIGELQEVALPYSEEAMALRLASFQKKAAKKEDGRKRKAAGRVAVLLAACFLLLLFSLSVTAATLGYSSVIAWLEESLFASDPPPADDLPANGILYTKSKETTLYKSISELWKTEGLSLLYPARLPGTAKLQRITEETGLDGEILWHFDFTNDSITLRVSNRPASTEPPADFNLYKTGLADFFFAKEADGSGYGLAVIDGYEYLFFAENYRDLFFIFDHLSTPNS